MSRTTENMQKDSAKGSIVSPDQITLVFGEALVKFRQGVAKYGDFDPATDSRDFLKETEAEILDAINYLAMFLMKLRAIREVQKDCR